MATKTKHKPLTELSDWELVNKDQDIRGWKVHDADGNVLGRVDNLLVSTDTELVELVRLDSGAEYPVRDIELGDKVVLLRGPRPAATGTEEPVVKMYDDTRVRRRTTERRTART